MINLIKKLLSRIELQVRKPELIDWRGKNIHPLEIVYHTNNSAAFFLMDIPILKCRTQLWNTLEECKNPFVKTIVDVNNKKNSDYNSSSLKKNYESYIPKNAAEVLRLNENEKLKKIPAYGYTLPWINQNVEEAIKTREKDALKENRKEGNPIGLSAGHTDFGPVTAEKGEIEFNRLVKIFNNIKKQGYIENPYLPDGAVKGYFLTGENDDWCFIIKSGKHRAYALSAMGYITIPVVIDAGCGFVKRIYDLPFWPQVKNGFFSEKEAFILANNILTAEHEMAKN